MDEIDIRTRPTEAERQTALLRKAVYWLQFIAAAVAIIVALSLAT